MFKFGGGFYKVSGVSFLWSKREKHVKTGKNHRFWVKMAFFDNPAVQIRAYFEGGHSKLIKNEQKSLFSVLFRPK